MSTTHLPISEIFTSWQGEGSLAGTPSVFVRTAGCDLRCGFCDTRYAWDAAAGEMGDVETLAEEILYRAKHPKFPQVVSAEGFTLTEVPQISHVVLTGGEPMMWPATVSLGEKLKKHGFHLTVETAGTRFLEVPCDLWSLSPKLGNARCERPREITAETLREFTKNGAYQLKFVVGTPGDMPEVLAFLERFPFLSRDAVFLMAQGVTAEEVREKEAWLGEMGFRVSPRGHLFWFKEKRGV